MLMGKSQFWVLSALLSIVASILVGNSLTHAQRNLIECGSIVEGVFTKKQELHTFTLRLESGDQVIAYSEPAGDTLTLAMALYNPVGEALAGSSTSPGQYYRGSSASWAGLSIRPTVGTEKLSGRGDHVLAIANTQFWIDGMGLTSSRFGGVGEYSIYVGCTLKDGTIVNPGDNANTSDSGTSKSSSNADELLTDGFPGLPPVDFSKATKLKLSPSDKVEGQISPSGGEVLGFTFDATEQQTFDLSFTRISGNLNLGLVILSSDNKVYFQTSLVTSSTLNTQFTLPAGKYTLGIFKIDLVTPTNPQITEFAITLK